MSDDVLTVKDVAEYLRIKPVTVYRLLSNNLLPGTKIGSNWRVPRKLILDWYNVNKWKRYATNKLKSQTSIDRFKEEYELKFIMEDKDEEKEK